MKPFRLVAIRLQALWHAFKHDSLFRNATFLVASTGIMSVIGFGFWVFVARLYPTADIGIASTLLAICTLLSNVSLLGLGFGLIRFIPGSKNPSGFINAASIAVGTVAFVAGLAYVLVGPLVGLHIAPFSASFWHAILFGLVIAATALNTLSDSVFIANRRAELHTVVYALFGLVRLFAPLLLIPFGAAGIFGAYVGAVGVSCVLSAVLMARYCGYRPLARPDWRSLRGLRTFAAHNYFGMLISGLPGQLIPSFILARLGASEAAFFALALTMANLIYIVPASMSQSLLAESSHDGSDRFRALWHAGRLLAVVLIPVVIVTVVAAPWLMHIFGEQYARNSTAVFELLVLSTPFIAVAALGTTVCNIAGRTRPVVTIQTLGVGVTLLTAWLWAGYGLEGIGWAFLAGNALMAVLHGLIIVRHLGEGRRGREQAVAVS